MSQIFLILRKDCRQFWLEISLTLAVTAAFIWLYPWQWQFDETSISKHFAFLDLNHLKTLATTVTVLLPVSWLVLIARVVHAENLLGTRQFRLTRPYDWRKLLTEKFLFFFLFLCIPFTLAQVCLLARAGFQPGHYAGPLLLNLASITIVVVLPLFVLAAITSSLLRIVVIFLAAAIGIAMIFFVKSNLLTPSISLPCADRFFISAITGFCGAALLIQYSSRKRWLAHALLVALVCTLAVFALHPLESYLLPRYYPSLAPGQSSPIVFGSTTVADPNVSEPVNGPDLLNVPIVITNNADHAVFAPNDIRISIEGPNGTRTTSAWQAVHDQVFLPDAEPTSIIVAVDRAFLEHMHTGPGTLHIDLALTELKAGHSAHAAFLPGSEMAMPQLGICTYESANPFGDFGPDATMRCRSPFYPPDLAQVSIPEYTSCDQAKVTRDSVIATAWTGALDHDLSDIGLTPVRASTINLDSALHILDVPREAWSACPGSLISITPYTLIRRFQTRFDVKLNHQAT